MYWIVLLAALIGFVSSVLTSPPSMPAALVHTAGVIVSGAMLIGVVYLRSVGLAK